MQIDGDFVGALDLLHEAEELYDTDYSPPLRPVPAIAARMHWRGAISPQRAAGRRAEASPLTTS